MRTLLIAPEVFLAEGGIARILRAYLLALAGSESAPQQVGAIVLNDSPASASRIPSYLRSTAISPLLLADRSKARFILACLRHARTTDRIICGHIHLAPVARLARVLNPRLAYYVLVHGIEVWRPYTRGERLALQNARRILCISEYTRRQILRFAPSLNPGQLAIVPNTLDPDFALPAAPPPRAAEPGPWILTVARLTQNDTYKGVDTLIEAMPQIRARLPNARLRIVGGGNDEGRLARLAAARGGPGAIDLLGRIDDDALRREYAQCDLFALPSRKEGFGLVYLEAMSFGKPCLGARAGGVPEVIGEDVGELVTYGHIDEIADACVRLARRQFDPEKIRAHLGSYSFDVFRRRLHDALTA